MSEIAQATGGPAARAIRLSALLRPSPTKAPMPCPDQIRAEATALARAQADTEWRERLAALEQAHARQLAEATQALSAAKDLQHTLIAKLEAQFGCALSQLALAIARQVIDAEPQVSVATLQSLLADALAALPEGDAGTIEIAPADMPRLAAPSGWCVVANADLSPGEVRARCGPALSRASLSLRLRAAETALGHTP